MYEQIKFNQEKEEVNDKWSGDYWEEDVDTLGTIILDLKYEYLSCDQKLAEICGWDKIPQDYNSNPYELCRIVKDVNDNKMMIFALSKMVSIDKDRTFNKYYRISDDELEKVINWINERPVIQKAEQDNKRLISEIFKANNLDDDSIKILREKLLEDHRLK